MRLVLERVSLAVCVVAGLVVWWVPFLVTATLLAAGLLIAATLDFTCPHQRRLYWSMKK